MSSYATGPAPTGVVAGNFANHFAHHAGDLAVANSGSDTVSILLNNGDGSFGAAADYVVGPNPRRPAYFVRHHRPHLAVAVGTNEVAVVIGNGDGTFQPAVRYTVGFNPQTVSVGDFNRDLKDDLAVANYGPAFQAGSVSILLGKGTDTFRAAHNYAAGINPVGLNVGDFNNDGWNDLAAVNNNPPFGQGISILLNNRDGTFQAPLFRSFPDGNPRGPAVGDFNVDGKLDLAVAIYGSAFRPLGNISVFLGNGNGTFQAPVDYQAGPHPSDIVARDMDRNGALDLVATNSAASSVSILHGRGDGTFFPQLKLTVGSGPVLLAVEQLSADDRLLDVATTNAIEDVVSVLVRRRC